MAEYMSREDYCEITCGKENRDGYKTCHNCSMLNVPTADVQPVDRWISVDDRLPEAVEEDVNGKIAFSDMVLVYLVYDNGFTYITVSQCRTDCKSWLCEIPSEGCKVTHWQPLPEPPKATKG